MPIISTYVHDLPLTTNPSQFEIPGFQVDTNAGAKAMMSSLVGPVGPTPNITVTASTLPYGSTPTVAKGGTAAAPTFNIGFPLAQDGKTPMFQTTATYIQYRYSTTDAWQNLVAIDTLRLHYSDLTAANKQELMAPALDAANTANTAAANANAAAQTANTAAANVKDGKTPVIQAGTATKLAEGANPTVTFPQTGTDTNGNPIYTLNVGIPKGDRGAVPQLVGNQLTSGAPGSVPVLVFTQTGTDTNGNPIYTVSGSIPKGNPGDGSGNVEVTADGLVAGNQYVFVPSANNTPIGTFQSITIPPAQVQADAAETDTTQPDYIKNLAQVGRDNDYNSLDNRPPLPEGGIWKNVTDMFDIPTQGDVKCLMDDSLPGRPLVHIFGTDTSGETNSLTITPAFGFGSYYERIGNDAIVIRGLAGGVPTDHLVTITAETPTTNSSISIPAACNYFELAYFVGTNTNIKSYYVTTDSRFYNFTLANTPITNFCTSGNLNSTITIEGTPVVKSSIRQIVFGTDYASTTSIPSSFLRYFPALTNVSDIGLSVFSNVTNIGDNVLQGCTYLQGVDLSAFTNVTAIGNFFMSTCNSLSAIDYSSFTNVVSIGSAFMQSCANLYNIQIKNVDFSSKTIGELPFSNVPNTSARRLSADSAYLAQAFKTKFPTTSSWSVVINS